MEGTMEQFTEKLAGLVELGKKNKNFLEYAQIDSYFKDMKLTSDMMEAIYDYLDMTEAFFLLTQCPPLPLRYALNEIPRRVHFR